MRSTARARIDSSWRWWWSSVHTFRCCGCWGGISFKFPFIGWRGDLDRRGCNIWFVYSASHILLTTLLLRIYLSLRHYNNLIHCTLVCILMITTKANVIRSITLISYISNTFSKKCSMLYLTTTDRLHTKSTLWFYNSIS